MVFELFFYLSLFAEENVALLKKREISALEHNKYRCSSLKSLKSHTTYGQHSACIINMNIK